MHILGGLVLQIFGDIDKSALFNWVMYTNTTKSVKIYAVRVTQRYAIAFLKSVKYISGFSQAFEWQEILRRKTNKSYDKTALRNDP